MVKQVSKKMATKYSGVYTDDKGRFFYQVYLGRDSESGKKITKKARYAENGKPFKTAHDAYVALIKIKNNYLEYNGKANYRVTFKTFMENNFIPKYKADVKESTFDSHSKAFNRLIERFGEKKLEDISIIDCEQYRTWLLNNYSSAYANLNYIALRQCLDYAITLSFLQENVAKRTKTIPKGKSVQGYWTKDDFQAVISHCYLANFEQHMNFLLIWLYFMTGIRVGEGQALQWSDIDFKNSCIRIYHNISFKNKDNYTINPYTKTASSMRVISIDSTTLSYLSEWKEKQASIINSDFILSYDGAPIPRSTVQRIIRRYARIANVPLISAKGLRHSHASYLINEFNADVLTVSRRLGHSSPEITLKYYSHFWHRNDKVLTDKMADNIQFTPTNTNFINFNGNQVIK